MQPVAVGAVPDSLSLNPFPSGCGITARIEWAVAEIAVLAVPVAGIELAVPVRAVGHFAVQEFLIMIL